MDQRAAEHALPDDLAGLGDTVRSAFEVASAAHANQVRKGDGSPYIAHPVRVASTVAQAGMDDVAVAAALLHDVVEDSPVTLDELRQRFDERVVGLVAAMSERKETDGYERRKNEHREQVERSGRTAALIYAADKLDNLRDMRRAYAADGEAIGDRFNAPIDLRVELWWSDLEMIERVTGGEAHVTALRDELEGFVAEREC